MHAEIASPRTPSSTSAEYFVAYYALYPGNEFRVYGGGPDGFFGTNDDTGDRSIQATQPATQWAPHQAAVSAFGDTVAYAMYQAPSQSLSYLFAKKPGNDGLVGLGGDDLVYAAELFIQGVPNVIFTYGSGNALDLISNKVLYGLYSTPISRGYLLSRDFGPDGVLGNDDILQVVNPDNPYIAPSNMFGYLQVGSCPSFGSIVSWSQSVPSTLDWQTNLFGPGPNALFEPRSSPTYDDEQHSLGGSGASEWQGQSSADSSFLIDIFRYPSQGTIINTNALLYDLRPLGSQNCRLGSTPISQAVPLPPPPGTPPGQPPFIEYVDVDGQYTGSQGLVAGSLAVVYSHVIPAPPPRYYQTATRVLFRDTGRDGNFLSGDDLIRSYDYPQFQTGDGIRAMQLKENMVVLVVKRGTAYNLDVIPFA